MTTIGGLVANGWFATGGGGSPTEPTAGEIASAVWAASPAIYSAAGTFGAMLQDSVSSVKTDVASVKNDTAAILIDTGTTLDVKIDNIRTDTTELQEDWTNGGRLDLLLDAVLADTNELQTDWANGGRLDTILDTAAVGGGLTVPTAGQIATAVLTTAMTESYSVAGGTMTLAQALYELVQQNQTHAIADTNWTVYRRDGSTVAFRLTLDDDETPTAATRTT